MVTLETKAAAVEVAAKDVAARFSNLRIDFQKESNGTQLKLETLSEAFTQTDKALKSLTEEIRALRRESSLKANGLNEEQRQAAPTQQTK
jgi:hypothetical protein